MSIIDLFIAFIKAILTGEIFEILGEVFYGLTPLLLLFLAPALLALGLIVIVLVCVGIVKVVKKVRKLVKKHLD